MTRPSVCFVGYHNLPILAPEYGHLGTGGEEVQHTLLAKSLAARGFDVSMVVFDHGQPEGAIWSGVRTHKAYRPNAGLPVLRFLHPRWTGLWAALARADAQVYYVSTAGVHVGQAVLFARARGRRVIFRVSHDANCSPRTLMIKYRRDRWLYEYGLRHVDLVLAQTEHQRRMLLENYGVTSTLAQMPVEPARRIGAFQERDIPVLWVNNLRRFKRPDLYVDLAARLPSLPMHMIGGPVPGFEDYHRQMVARIRTAPNLHYHGPVPYHAVNDFFERTRVFVNTSDTEGYPNSYLQAWARGTPVVAFFDPDGVIAREGLGVAAQTPDELARAVATLSGDPQAWAQCSARCTAYMQREFDPDRVLAPYADAIASLSAR
ncbi:MAG: glycosyltransferase family 4 protein [Gammaproteobacteria bacterium]